MGKRKWKAKKLEHKLKKDHQNDDDGNEPNHSKSKRQKANPTKAGSGKIEKQKSVDRTEMRANENDDIDTGFRQAKTNYESQKGRSKSGGFQSMGLSQSVLRGVIRRGYKVPSPIQRKTIPIILEGKDVVAMARTGSGKTAAFLVPMFEKLKSHSSTGARAVIMSPTRELALQTLKFCKELGKFTSLKAAVILGGDKIDDQFAALHDNPDIILATPGRFLHVLVEMEMKLKLVEYIVFDEADRLFEMGFQDQLQEIIRKLPEFRQTLLFSATLPKSLVEFARAGLTDPTLIRLDVETKLSTNLQTSYLKCRDADKLALLMYLLKYVVKRKELTVVFAATKHHVEFLQQLLTLSGISCTYIYSSLDQTARKINAAKFSVGRVKVLIVTDLAARGIDVPLLDNVINFNFPAKPKLFVHRVGRVARAGRSGTAYSLISPEEMAHLVDLHLFLGRPLKPIVLGQPVEDDDGCLGEVPQSLIDDEDVLVRKTIVESADLTSLQKVCDNAYKKYMKSRQAPASESQRRVRKFQADGMVLGTHPLFGSVLADESETRLEMLNALKSYKPKTTIFEINSTSKKKGLEVMKAKREQHEQIILNNEARQREQKEVASMKAASSQPLPGADQEEIDAVFQGPSASKKKKHDNAKELKDKENFIEYKPSDYASEKGLSIVGGGGGNFEKEAAGAVLDFMEDEKDNSKPSRKWDRKKKKYVTESREGKKKMIKTESGHWIPASYKSSAYNDWKKRSNQADINEENEDSHQRKRHSHFNDGRFSVSGIRKRKWHTKGNEDDMGSKQKKQKFKGEKNRLKKDVDHLLKKRRQKTKAENFQKYRQNIREKRRDGGQKKGKGK